MTMPADLFYFFFFVFFDLGSYKYSYNNDFFLSADTSLGDAWQ